MVRYKHLMEAKDPDADLRYVWDLRNEIPDGVSVTSHEVVDATGGVTVGSTSEQDGVVSALVSGGDVWDVAHITLRYTTDDGEGDDVTIVVPIRPT